MIDFPDVPEGLLRSTDFLRAGRNDRELRRARSRDELHTVMPGVFVGKAAWEAASKSEQHRLLAHAFAPRLGPKAVFSHDTAALLHGWQSLGPGPPALLEVTDAAILRTRRGTSARLHASPLSGLDVDIVGALPVTAPARTAVDVVISKSFRQAVVTLDSALHVGVEHERALARGQPLPATPPSLLTLDEFDAALGRRLPVRCHNHVSRVRQFADGGAGSVGESLSRIVMHERRWPAPTLQREFFDAEGRIGEVDFWWEEFGIIGEFDGAVKYSRGEYLRGRTPAEAAIAEKRREDRLRALPEVRGFARWMWNDAWLVAGMERRLAAAGLRQ